MIDNLTPKMTEASQAVKFETIEELQNALTQAEGLMSVALFCLYENPKGVDMIGGVEAAIVKAMANVKATGNALDAVNVHKLAEFRTTPTTQATQ